MDSGTILQKSFNHNKIDITNCANGIEGGQLNDHSSEWGREKDRLPQLEDGTGIIEAGTGMKSRVQSFGARERASLRVVPKLLLYLFLPNC
jgi:hypothetical protein